MKPRNILKVIDDEAKDISTEAMKETLVIVVNPFDFKLPIISVYDNPRLCHLLIQNRGGRVG